MVWAVVFSVELGYGAVNLDVQLILQSRILRPNNCQTNSTITEASSCAAFRFRANERGQILRAQRAGRQTESSLCVN